MSVEEGRVNLVSGKVERMKVLERRMSETMSFPQASCCSFGRVKSEDRDETESKLLKEKTESFCWSLMVLFFIVGY